MIRPVKNIYRFISELPFIKGNPVPVNILLFLLITGYFIVGEDLSKDISTEKDEIGFFTATLQNSVSFDNSAVLKILERIPPEIGIIPPVSFIISLTDVKLFPPGRAPPII